MLELNAA